MPDRFIGPVEPTGDVDRTPGDSGDGSGGAENAPGAAPGDAPRRGRGRGKPRAASESAVDPRAVGGTGESAGGKRPRKKKDVDLTESLQSALVIMHALAANALRIPELALTGDQAQALAVAGANVAKLYDMEMPAHLVAWGNLAMVAGAVYGGKLMAYSARMRAGQRLAPAQPQAGNGAMRPAPASTYHAESGHA